MADATQQQPMTTAIRMAIYALSLAVVIMLVRDARAITVPLLTAAFLAVLGLPLFERLKARRIPVGLAAVAVVLVMLGALAVTGFILTNSLSALSSRVPEYQQALGSWFAGFSEGPGARLVELAGFEGDRIDSAFSGVLTSLITQLLGVVGNSLIILIIVAFMLVEADSLPAKLEAAFGESPQRQQMIDSFTTGLLRYAELKTVICLATGFIAGLYCWILGLDVPLLLGFLAFVLNYIPNLGSWLAGVPAVLLGVVEYGTPGVLIVGIGYLVINTLISNIIEPRVMGKGLGLSPLVIFVALMGFGWMLGPVGVVLAIPLVMTLRLALASHPSTAPIATLMESAAEAETS